MVLTGDCAESAWCTCGLTRNSRTKASTARVESGREQHPLAAGRGPAEDPADGGQEAEVGHVVGLVEDGDLDVGQRAVALLDQVLQPAGAGDDDVGAAPDGRDLRALTDAAEHGP